MLVQEQGDVPSKQTTGAGKVPRTGNEVEPQIVSDRRVYEQVYTILETSEKLFSFKGALDSTESSNKSLQNKVRQHLIFKDF